MYIHCFPGEDLGTQPILGREPHRMVNEKEWVSWLDQQLPSLTQIVEVRHVDS